MKIYYPDKQYDTYKVVEFKTFELWKRMSPIDFFSFIKKCYISKEKCQQFCDWENAPDVDFGGILQLKF